MQKQPLLIGIAAILLLSAALLFARQCRGTAAASPAQNAVGTALVERISALLGGAGSVVMLTPSGTDGDTPESAAFAAALARNAKGLQRAGCEAWTAQWSSLEGGGGVLSAATYAAVVARYPSAGAVVSFEGVPDPREVGRWPAGSARLIVVSARQPRELVAAAKPAIQAAYVARANPSSGESPRRGTPDQIFQQLFETL